jgi:hypothetical protein
MSSEEIMDVLKEMKSKNEVIQATMVAKAGLEGIIMFPESFKEDAAPIWDPLSKNLDDMLLLVKKYGEIGLEKSYSEILGYGMLFKVLKNSDTALVAIIKKRDSLEGVCDIMDEMEKSCESIYKIIGF